MTGPKRLGSVALALLALLETSGCSLMMIKPLAPPPAPPPEKEECDYMRGMMFSDLALTAGFGLLGLITLGSAANQPSDGTSPSWAPKVYSLRSEHLLLGAGAFGLAAGTFMISAFSGIRSHKLCKRARRPPRPPQPELSLLPELKLPR